MKIGKQEIVLVNDRVLIKRETPDERTHRLVLLRDPEWTEPEA